MRYINASGSFYPAVRMAGKKDAVTTYIDIYFGVPIDLHPEGLVLFRAASEIDSFTKLVNPLTE